MDYGSSLTVRNCVLTQNNADIGGAIYLRGGGSLNLFDCDISGNVAEYGLGGVFLGADFPATGSVQVGRCRFIGNSAQGGGGLGVDFLEAEIVSCLAVQNEGGFVGGGMIVTGSGSVVANCVISRNSAEMSAGINSGDDIGDVTIVNCSIANNLGRGVGGRPVISNCIVWGNETQLNSAAQTTYSDIQGGFPGVGNIDADPVFIQPGTDDLRLGFDSPCLDAGSAAALPPDDLDLDGDGDTGEHIPYDLADLPRVQGSQVDMGAYEGGYDGLPPAASADDLDEGEAAVLVPEGMAPDPTDHPAVIVWNVSGGNHQSFTVTQQDGPPLPLAAGYSEISSVLSTETTLGSGHFVANTYIAFDAADLGVADPLQVNVTSFDAGAGAWALAVEGNVSASPGHPGPVGDRIVVEGPGGFGVTMDIGDYGVYWDPTEQRGFGWANLDHAGDFGVGLALCPSDCVQSDGVVGIVDFLTLIGTWGTGGPCDVDGDGVIGYLDLATLLGDWGPCIAEESAGAPASPTGPPVVAARAVVRSADIDGDGRVAQGDFARLRQSWGACDGCPADLNADGSVDAADMMALFSRWGAARD